MAIAKAFDNPNQLNDDISFGVRDYAIGGKLVTATYQVSYLDAMAWKSDFEDHVKETLANKLAKYLLDNKLIEFTRQSTPINEFTSYRAHLYAAPNDAVKILRISVK
jgi:hypothetical protein